MSFITWPYYISLVTGEKRSALLAEVARLRAERNPESGEDSLHSSLQPCRGTVSISNIQLPLKVEFVCSSHNKSGTSTLQTGSFLTFSYVPTFSLQWRATLTLRLVFRTAKSLLLCADPLRPVQHRSHPAGHGCRRSEWRYYLLPHCCHFVRSHVFISLLLPVSQCWAAHCPETLFCFSTCCFRKDIRSSFEIDVEVYSLVSCFCFLILKNDFSPREQLSLLVVLVAALRQKL